MSMADDINIKLDGFTDSERACISRHVSKKVGEGWKQDQAVAAAINICAPSKSRPNKAAEAKLMDSRLGGRYEAADNGDGTFDILDVPIMAEVPAGEKQNREAIGREWMEKAVEAAQVRLAGGYMAPLHVRHKDLLGVTPTTPAGFVVPRRVAMKEYDGAQRWTMFADLRRIPAEIFRRIAALEIPYRSIEARWTKAEIQSLALLEDDAPFFKFEMLSVGHVKPAQNRELQSEHFAASFAQRGEGALVFCNYFGGDMEKPEAEAKPADGEKPAAAPDAKPDLLANLATMFAVLGQKIDSILQLITGASEAKPAQGAGMEPAELPDGAKPTAMKEQAQALLKENATLDAKAAAIDARVAAIERREKVKAIVDGARAQLAEWPASDDVFAKIATLAEKDPSGEAVKAFVEAYQAGVPKDPPSRLSEATGQDEADPAEVLEFSSKGPKALEEVRKISRLYDEAKQHQLVDVDRRRFIQIQMRALDGSLGR